MNKPLKHFIALLLVSVLLLFLLSERFCSHEFIISNKRPDPVQILIQAGDKTFQTKRLNASNQKIYRFDLRHFEGDLFIEVINLRKKDRMQYDIGYTYQGNASNYTIDIQPHSIESKHSETKTGFIDTLKFLFISASRYKGCYISSFFN